jgi:iron(III) transport system substrate-binding protein
MRAALDALGLILALAGGAGAEGFEEDRLFPATGQETGRLSVISTTDTRVFAPVIERFQALNPGIALRHAVTGSADLHQRLAGPDAAEGFDLAISSAMDLQMKLANDGRTLPHALADPAALPRWARWQDRLFAFTQEPVGILVSRRALSGLPPPRSRQDLVALLRDHPARFEGRIGTYDPAESGAGYLFATQDARLSDTFWRLAEQMGGLHPRLYGATSDMIADLAAGRLAMAYNVLGSYATPRVADNPDLLLIEPEDHTLTLLRTALIPLGAARPDLAGRFIDFLLSEPGRRALREGGGLPPVDGAALARAPHHLPIRLDPGLLVHLDPLQRQRFLAEWSAAMLQP